MPGPNHLVARIGPYATFILLVILLAGLWIAGGASRADAIGQALVRIVAWVILIITILVVPRSRWTSKHLQEARPVAIFLFAAVALTALQLVPLPPSIWTSLPGRDVLADTASIVSVPQPWRPLSISPSATANALHSLVVPLCALVLAATLGRDLHWRLLELLLVLILGGAVLGLLQFSGASIDNPFINDARNYVSGPFANRNHCALFLACGCLLAPIWAFGSGRDAVWRMIAAFGLIIFFGLVILATGSRTGLVLGILATVAGWLAVRRPVTRVIAKLPRKTAMAIGAGVLVGLGLAVVLSISLGRAVSVERALTMETGEDLRFQALPTVLSMIERYFPFGSGLGAFDPVYRMAEPDALLSLRYFNHAHNDFLEIVLDAGLPGVILLAAALVWFVWQSLRAWRARRETADMLPRTGSILLLLILLASVTDYPGRTPLMMAFIVIAAVWLGRAGGRTGERQ